MWHNGLQAVTEMPMSYGTSSIPESRIPAAVSSEQMRHQILLPTAHHRAQLAGYPRMLDKPVSPIYGPTADATWIGADPTQVADAARRG